MDLHVRDGLIEGYEELIDGIKLPDPNDRHVLAAAIKANAQTIVTYNLSDFPSSALSKYEIDAQHSVNPAFTSIIGQVNYAKRYGLSIHLAAALCIARRYQNFSEAPCSPIGKIPDGKGGHVAFVLPVRNRTKHVWHFWGQVKKKIKTVLAAHFLQVQLQTACILNGKFLLVHILFFV